MKGIVLSSVVAALVIFSGCSNKEVAVDDKKPVEQEVIQEVTEAQTETVSPKDSVVKPHNIKITGSETSSISSDNNFQDEGVAEDKNVVDLKSKLQTVYFAFDKYNITPQMQERIDIAAKALESADNVKIKLEGNCDEWGSDEYNFALGLKRANAVKKAMIANGIDASRISMVSYGESNPVCMEKTKECWAKNRRVDFKILP